MPQEKKIKKTLIEETFEEIETIKEVLSNHASSLINSNIKNELENVVLKALNEAEDDEEIENPETGKDLITGAEDEETPEVPSDDTQVDDVPVEPEDDMADELPAADDAEMGGDVETPIDDMPTPDEPEMDSDVVDLTGASDEEVLKIFKKMGPEDEIEVVQTPDGNIELNIHGEEFFIKQAGGGEEPNLEPDGDENIPTDELVAEGDYKQELSRVKAMGNKGGAGDRTDVKSPKTTDVAEVGESSNINDNQDENADKRKDVKNPKENAVATVTKEGENIDGNVKANFDHGKSDKRSDVKKPKEVGVAKVEGVQGNMSMEGANNPNYDRGTKSTPVNADPKVSAKTTVGIAENVQTLKKRLDENHEKLVYTRQKYAEVVAENAKLREQINTLNESVDTFKKEEGDYQHAIKVLKEQFNEVALFTSNLTYAVKLMTEHATTKEEKNKILKQLDGAKTLNESKNIYESLSASFGEPTKKVKTIEEQINKSSSSGASTINESTAYQNPELSSMLARQKELIKKIK